MACPPRPDAQPLLGAGHHLDWLHLMCPSQGELRDSHECQTGRASPSWPVSAQRTFEVNTAPTSPPMPRLFCVACDYSVLLESTHKRLGWLPLFAPFGLYHTEVVASASLLRILNLKRTQRFFL